MQRFRPSNYLATALILSLTLPVAHAQQPQIPAALLHESSAFLNSKLSKKEQAKLQTQSVEYISSILGTNPSQISETKQVDPASIQDLSQLDTTDEELNTLKSWARMYDDGTL